MSRILLTGATGLLGGALIEALIPAGHEVRCLLRNGSPNSHRLDPAEVEIAIGDADDAEAVSRAASGVDAVIHAAGIEYAPPLVEGMRRAGAGRLVAVSSTSAHSAYETRSGPKLSMEAVVRKSGLSWTVVRPTMIYGSERDKNMRRLLRFLDRSLVFPVFGSGDNLWQPVYHEDLAQGILAALENPAAVGETYDLPGAASLGYGELVRTAARALEREVRLLSIPLQPVYRASRLAERAGLRLPVGSDQVQRLREDKAYPYEKARRELGYAPRTFEEGIQLEVERLRMLGMLRG
ncbi:NAD-dependent epimerase/dehydratase family protein [Rubrobacter aplysinae]|uniref:NAD-dependent epimerase/dehydratase family protein n=1 Tax=Rubrobacter aplysinae TaxID=909625 RepID=UPI00064BF011|nr:NAD(P)H-binding protein [Rubrobacter aplysinae]